MHCMSCLVKFIMSWHNFLRSGLVVAIWYSALVAGMSLKAVVGKILAISHNGQWAMGGPGWATRERGAARRECIAAPSEYIFISHRGQNCHFVHMGFRFASVGTISRHTVICGYSDTFSTILNCYITKTSGN